ncbi:MAG: cobyrinate a,c-diamide synthase, partial [Desulfobacterales bacterium]|nr:cobyrinate a,c-diamide synthase [Desulfobacterales bacterium]
MEVPRIVISALRGGAGKTIISIGIIAALRNLNKPVAPFKKGPDYIDAGWLTLAAGRPCYNLDTFLLPAPKILNSFFSHASPSDIAVIEGNRGLYDGIDIAGSTSTAELAKLLNCPVIMCLDCTKTTRTVAAVVAGCRQFDSAVAIKGVILNRVAGLRHEKILTDSIEQHCGLPVIGAIPKLKRQQFPERHMGLVPTHEHDWAKNSIAAAAEMAANYLDLNRILKIALAAPVIDSANVVEADDRKNATTADNLSKSDSPRIGVIKDSAFQFYYPENIEALECDGAEVVFISPLERSSLPQIDALYIGGGFPETHAGQLAANRQFREELKDLINVGLPVYAECGGLMYLGKELRLDDNTYPMVDVLPVSFNLSKRPQG